MGFKSNPWMLYYKPSLKEFVIRQRHTEHRSQNVKEVNNKLREVAGTEQHPARIAHESLEAFAGRPVYKYVGGTKYIYYPVPIQLFKSKLSAEMKQLMNTRKVKAQEGGVWKGGGYRIGLAPTQSEIL